MNTSSLSSCMARWRSGALSYHDNFLTRPWGYSLTVLPSRRSYFGEQTLEHPPRDTSDNSGFRSRLGSRAAVATMSAHGQVSVGQRTLKRAAARGWSVAWPTFAGPPPTAAVD